MKYKVEGHIQLTLSINRTVEAIDESEAYWKVFSKYYSKFDINDNTELFITKIEK